MRAHLGGASLLPQLTLDSEAVDVGAPLRPAMSCRAGKKGGQIDCSRPFATGTCAYLSTHGADARSCVWWSDGAVVGDEATCANADIRRSCLADCEAVGCSFRSVHNVL